MFGILGKAISSKFSGDEETISKVYDYTGVEGVDKLINASKADLVLGIIDPLEICEKELTKTKTLSFVGAVNSEEDISGRSFSLAQCEMDESGDEYILGRYLISDDDKVIVSKSVSFDKLLDVYKEDDLSDLTGGGDIGIIKARKKAVKKGLDDWFAERYRLRLYMPITRDGQIVDYYLLSDDAESKTMEIFVYRDSRTEVFTGFVYDADTAIEKISVEE